MTEPDNRRPRLLIEEISTYYDEKRVLYDLSIKVLPNEVVALLGASGAGKTTTLRSILGLTRPRRGTVAFDGQDITRWATHAIARAGVSWVPDDRRIFPTLTVARNLELGQKRTRFPPWELAGVFDIFTALEHLMDRVAGTLSGGEMQMVAIARALLGSPGLVLLDEPTQGLAPKVVDDVLSTIRHMKEKGVSVLLVEQQAELALEVSDRVYVIDRGSLVHAGDSATLLADTARRKALIGV